MKEKRKLKILGRILIIAVMLLCIAASAYVVRGTPFSRDYNKEMKSTKVQLVKNGWSITIGGIKETWVVQYDDPSKHLSAYCVYAGAHLNANDFDGLQGTVTLNIRAGDIRLPNDLYMAVKGYTDGSKTWESILNDDNNAMYNMKKLMWVFDNIVVNNVYANDDVKILYSNGNQYGIDDEVDSGYISDWVQRNFLLQHYIAYKNGDVDINQLNALTESDLQRINQAAIWYYSAKANTEVPDQNYISDSSDGKSETIGLLNNIFNFYKDTSEKGLSGDALDKRLCSG